MHLAEGVLPLSQAVAWSTVAAPTVYWSLRREQRTRRNAPSSSVIMAGATSARTVFRPARRSIRARQSQIELLRGVLGVEADPHLRIDPRRFVFQGVHMLFDGQPDRPWGDAPRRNQLIFIGRNLPEQSMRQGFEACLI